MKNNRFLVILSILVVFIVGGSSDVWAKKHKQPSLDKIQKAQEKANERLEKQRIQGIVNTIGIKSYQPEWKSKLGLLCPDGGKDDVVVQPALGRQLEAWIGGGGFVMNVLSSRYVMLNRVKNPYHNLRLNITNGAQVVVTDMCPGGSITLVQSMPFLPSMLSGSNTSLRVIWTAEGEKDGRMAYGEISPGTLYSGTYNWEAVAKRPTWIMNLDRVDKNF